MRRLLLALEGVSLTTRTLCWWVGASVILTVCSGLAIGTGFLGTSGNIMGVASHPLRVMAGCGVWILGVVVGCGDCK